MPTVGLARGGGDIPHPVSFSFFSTKISNSCLCGIFCGMPSHWVGTCSEWGWGASSVSAPTFGCLLLGFSPVTPFAEPLHVVECFGSPACIVDNVVEFEIVFTTAVLAPIVELSFGFRPELLPVGCGGA